jgi:hypothetical protein
VNSPGISQPIKRLYWLNDWSSIPKRNQDFPLHDAQTGSGWPLGTGSYFLRSKEPGAWDRPFTSLLSRLGTGGASSPILPTYFQGLDTGTSPLLGTILTPKRGRKLTNMSLVHPWLVPALLRIACSINHNRLTTQLTQLAPGCTVEKLCFSTHSQNLMMWNNNRRVTVVSHPLETLEHWICTHVIRNCHSCAVLNSSNSVLRAANKYDMMKMKFSGCSKIIVLPKFRIRYNTIR